MLKFSTGQKPQMLLISVSIFFFFSFGQLYTSVISQTRGAVEMTYYGRAVKKFPAVHLLLLLGTPALTAGTVDLLVN